MNDNQFNRIVDGFKSLPWRDTMFMDVEYYYAEEGRYIVHIKAREDERESRPEQFRIVSASNPDQAIAFACFDMGLKKTIEPTQNT